MYIRPSKRAKVHTDPVRTHVPRESYIGSIIHKNATQFYEPIKRPVYNQKDYIKGLKKNYEECGLVFKDPMLPTVIEVSRSAQNEEPELEFCDRIQVTLKVLKNGVVRVKINCAIASLYEKYWKHAKSPPFKAILQAYKSHGFSSRFIERIKLKHEKKLLFSKKVAGIIEKIFDKEPVKKPKKEKKKIVEDEELNEEEPNEEDNPPKSDEPEEEETLDVEPDEDEEEVEEEYFSEPDT